LALQSRELRPYFLRRILCDTRCEAFRLYTRILVPLDGSAYSEQVLPIAAGLASQAEVPLVLQRSVLGSDLIDMASSDLARAAQRYGVEALPVGVSTKAAEAIVQDAGAAEDTLIAMTTHGFTGILETLLGSVALEVLGKARRGVLLYRPAAGNAHPGHRVRSVVLALDGSELAEAMEPEAAALANWLGAKMVIVQALPVVRDAAAEEGAEAAYVRAAAERARGAYNTDTEWDVLHGPAGAAVSRFVSGRTDVILAMTTHGRSGLGRALFGSVAAHCLRHAGVPILMRSSG